MGHTTGNAKLIRSMYSTFVDSAAGRVHRINGHQ